MSTEVDKRIVEMEFKNQEFEKNAQRTKKTLEELENSLNFDGEVSKSLDVISSKFTNLGIIGQRVLTNLTDSVMDLGKKMVSAIAFDGMTEGFGQYESILTSTKVLTNATGEDLQTVTKYLDELQRYAEKTVYDFSFMTNNITKFVNAGIDLKTSVQAMEGLGNAMAYAGVEGQQAYQVIYNASQALSTGYMGLMDWKSIELAGMATKQFKQILLDTAVDMGTVIKVEDKYQSVTTDLNGHISDLMDTETMRNSLATRWLTNDVFIAALQKYNDETTELGQAAIKAASDITKFSKMMDALKEERSGGWASTFKIIFGDLEESTEFWTGVYNRIEKWMTSMKDFRNTVLQVFVGFGGRNNMIASIHNVFDFFETLSKPMADAVDRLFAYNKGWQYLEDVTDTINIGPLGNVLYESMVKASRGVKAFTESIIPSDETLRSISDILLGIFTIIRDVVEILTPIIVVIGKVIKIVTPLFKILLAIAGVLGNIIFQISNAVREALNLGPAFKNVTEFLDFIYNKVNDFSDNVVETLYTIPDKVAEIIESIKNGTFKLPDLKGFVNGIIEGLTNAINNFKENKTLGSFFEGFLNTEAIKQIGASIQKAFDNIVNNTETFIGKLREKLLELGPVGNLIVSIFDFIASEVKIIIDSIAGMSTNLTTVFAKVGDKIVAFFYGLDFTDVLDVAKVAVFVASMIRLRKSLKTIADIANEAKEVLSSAKDGIKKFATAIDNVGKGVKLSLQAEAFKNIAYGLGIIVGSVIALSTIDSDKLRSAVDAFTKIVAITSVLVIVINSIKTEGDKTATAAQSAVKALEKIGMTFAKGASLAMIFGSVSALIVSIMTAIITLGSLDYATVNQGINAITRVFINIASVVGVIGAVIAILTLINKIPSKTVSDDASMSMFKIATNISILALGLSAIAKPIAKLGAMDADVFTKGFTAMNKVLGILGLLFIGTDIYSKISQGFTDNIAKLSLSILGLSAALLTIIAPIAILGRMNPETLSNGLRVLGSMILYLSTAFIGLGLAARIMGKTGAPILKMALAFGTLTIAISTLALMAPIISSNAEKIEQAIITLVNITVNALVESSDKIINGLLELISKTLVQLHVYLPQIVDELEDVLDILLDWLVGYMPVFSLKLGKIVGTLLNSLIDSIKESLTESNLKILLGGTLTIILLMNVLATTLKRFSTNVSFKQVSKAIISISLVVAAMIGIFKLLEIAGLDPTHATAYSLGMSISLLAISVMAKTIGRVNSSVGTINFKNILGILLEIEVIIAVIGGIISLFAINNYDPLKVIAYSAALSLSFIGMVPMLKALEGVQKYANRAVSMKPMIGLLIEIGGIAATLGVVLGILTKTGLNPIKMALYSGALSLAFIGLTPMIKALAKVQTYAEKTNKFSIKPLVGMFIAVGAIASELAIVLGILTTTSIDPVKMAAYAGGLSVAFIGVSPMILALAIVQKATKGITNHSLVPMTGIFIAVGGVALAMATAFSTMQDSRIDPMAVIKYAEALSLAMLAITPFAIAMGVMSGIFAKLGIDGISMISTGFGIIGVISIALVIFGMLATLVGALDYLADGQILVALENSVSIFENVGKAIGALLGGLFGGIGGATLSAFASTAEPFFDAISALPNDFGEKMTALAAGFLALTGAGFVNAISDLFTLFTGDISLIKLGQDLSSFAPYIAKFVDKFPDITLEQAESIKRVSEGLKSLMHAIPKGGGWLQTILGETKLTSFTENLGELGRAMKTFATETEGLNSASVEQAVNCGMMMAGLADNLPKTGGVIQWWMGEVDMQKFSDNLPGLGKAIVEFNDAVTSENGGSRINSESVETAVNAGKLLAGLNSNLPATGGKLQKWLGEKDLGKFGENLKPLGEAIVEFNNVVTQNGSSVINEESVKKAVWVAEEINALWKNMPESTWFSSFPDLKVFASSIPGLGLGIADFSREAEGINETSVATAISSLDEIAKMQKFLTGEEGGWIDRLEDNKRVKKFIDNIPKFGEGIKALSDNMAGADISRIETATNALNSLSDMVKLSENLGGFSLETFQKAINNIDVKSFYSAAEAVTSDKNLKTMAEKFKDIGRGYIQNLYIGLTSTDAETKRIKDNSIKDVVGSLSNDMKTYAADQGYSIGKNLGLGMYKGMWDPEVIKWLKNQAISLVEGVKMQMEAAAGIASPSKMTMKIGRYIDEGLGIGIRDNANLATNPAYAISDEAIGVMNEAMLKVYSLMASGADFEPTIAPVVDLTNARQSVSELNALFSQVSMNPELGFGTDYSLDLTRNVKMEAESTIKPTDLTKVTDGIAKIGQKLSDMEQAISDMQIYLDTGVLVGNMTTPMMNAINRQNRSINRGVIPSRVK